MKIKTNIFISFAFHVNNYSAFLHLPLQLTALLIKLLYCALLNSTETLNISNGFLHYFHSIPTIKTRMLGKLSRRFEMNAKYFTELPCSLFLYTCDIIWDSYN